jgi:hypothetical protein
MPVAVKYRKYSSFGLNKDFVVQSGGWRVFSVDASAVRCIAQPDEEFGNFATHEEFPNLIPKGEIWIGRKNLDKEGVFFLANILTRLRKQHHGISEDQAYTAGLNVERLLREKMTGLKFRNGKSHGRVPRELYIQQYITLPDPEFPIEVWLVDGNMVRCLYKTDYTEGGHGFVYRWVPKQQIWIEKDLDQWELPFIVSHEYLELRLMRDHGVEYDHAHEICSKVEFHLRKGKGIKPILGSGPRGLKKRDLVKLPKDEVLEHVVNKYLRRKAAPG